MNINMLAWPDPNGPSSLWRKLVKNVVSIKSWKRLFLRAQERLAGVDFLTVLQAEDVGLDPNNANRSSASGNKWLRNVLKHLSICSEDSIVDIGCQAPTSTGATLYVLSCILFGRPLPKIMMFSNQTLVGDVKEPQAAPMIKSHELFDVAVKLFRDTGQFYFPLFFPFLASNGSYLFVKVMCRAYN